MALLQLKPADYPAGWGGEPSTASEADYRHDLPDGHNMQVSGSLVSIALESPTSPDLVGLIEARQDYFQRLYPAMRNPLADVETLTPPTARFIVLREGGRALAFGALVDLGEGTAELKAMFLDASFRGRGYGHLLLNALEHEARRWGMVVLRAETGRLQTEALTLYKKNGYAETGPFGGYIVGANSVFLERHLAV